MHESSIGSPTKKLRRNNSTVSTESCSRYFGGEQPITPEKRKESIDSGENSSEHVHSPIFAGSTSRIMRQNSLELGANRPILNSKWGIVRRRVLPRKQRAFNSFRENGNDLDNKQHNRNNSYQMRHSNDEEDEQKRKLKGKQKIKLEQNEKKFNKNFWNEKRSLIDKNVGGNIADGKQTQNQMCPFDIPLKHFSSGNK